MEFEQLGHVFVTSRDIAILLSLYENTVMTFSQLARRHFLNLAKPTAINRLTKLESAGLLRRERIPKMELGRDNGAVGVIFQITRRGILRLKERHPEIVFKPEPIRTHPYTLNHDLIVNDVMEALRLRCGGEKIINGKLLGASSHLSQRKDPDLVVVDGESGSRVAIEVELNDKSEKRYREIVLRYRMSRDYQKVVYFCARRDIERAIQKVILGRAPMKNEHPLTGKFYFAGLEQFLTTPMELAVSNGEANFWRNGECL